MPAVFAKKTTDINGLPRPKFNEREAVQRIDADRVAGTVGKINLCTTTRQWLYKLNTFRGETRWFAENELQYVDPPSIKDDPLRFVHCIGAQLGD